MVSRLCVQHYCLSVWYAVFLFVFFLFVFVVVVLFNTTVCQCGKKGFFVLFCFLYNTTVCQCSKQILC